MTFTGTRLAPHGQGLSHENQVKDRQTFPFPNGVSSTYRLSSTVQNTTTLSQFEEVKSTTGPESASHRSLSFLVGLHVCFQTMSLSEGFLTECTLIRSLPVVSPHVDFQVLLPRACFPTDPTHERFEVRMHRHVVVQMDFTFEGPATVWAAVRCLPRVDPYVNRQGSLRAESLPTLATLVRLLIGVRSHVDLQLLARQEHFAAHVAEVWTIPLRVNLLVLSERAQKFETPPTTLTAVWSLLDVGHLVAG